MSTCDFLVYNVIEAGLFSATKKDIVRFRVQLLEHLYVNIFPQLTNKVRNALLFIKLNYCQFLIFMEKNKELNLVYFYNLSR